MRTHVQKIVSALLRRPPSAASNSTLSAMSVRSNRWWSLDSTHFCLLNHIVTFGWFDILCLHTVYSGPSSVLNTWATLKNLRSIDWSVMHKWHRVSTDEFISWILCFYSLSAAAATAIVTGTKLTGLALESRRLCLPAAVTWRRRRQSSVTGRPLTMSTPLYVVHRHFRSRWHWIREFLYMSTGVAFSPRAQARRDNFSTGGSRSIKSQVLLCNMIRWFSPHLLKSCWLLDRWSLPLFWHLSDISAICNFWPQFQILGVQLTPPDPALIPLTLLWSPWPGLPEPLHWRPVPVARCMLTGLWHFSSWCERFKCVRTGPIFCLSASVSGQEYDVVRHIYTLLIMFPTSEVPLQILCTEACFNEALIYTFIFCAVGRELGRGANPWDHVLWACRLTESCMLWECSLFSFALLQQLRKKYRHMVYMYRWYLYKCMFAIFSGIACFA